MSAYALNCSVRAHAPLYRELKQGNVYNTIAKLNRDGMLLAKITRSDRGPAPTKAVFRLSVAGERRFQTLLRAIVLDVQAPDPAIEIAYVLLGQLLRNEALALLQHRLKAVVDQESRLGRLFGGTDERSGTGYLALSHTVAHLRGEAQYLRDSVKLLQNKAWSPEWDAGDGPVVKSRLRA